MDKVQSRQVVRSSTQLNRGFTLIELIIVVIILGLLAATALPRFIDATSKAEDASVEGVAGGFAAAVGLVRSQWELDGRPNGNVGGNKTQLQYDKIIVGIDGDIGYPTTDSSENDTRASEMNANKCRQVLNAILQSAPVSTISANQAEVQQSRFLVRFYSNNNLDSCIYYLTSSVKLDNIPADNSSVASGTQGFIYTPATGEIEVFGEN